MLLSDSWQNTLTVVGDETDMGYFVCISLSPRVHICGAGDTVVGKLNIVHLWNMTQNL